MAKLPTFKKLLPESFPDLKWFPELVAPINKFMEDVTRALTSLRFSDNFDGAVRTVQVDGTYPVKFSWSNPQSRPTVAWIGQCREVSGNHTTITDALYLDWEFSGDGMFIINNIAGLSASPTNKFNVTIIAVSG